MDITKIKEVFADKAFVADLLATEDAIDVQKKLAAKGIDLTNDEVVLLGMELTKYASGEKRLPENYDELSDAELTGVSGGVIQGFALAGIMAAAAAATGLVIGFGGSAINKATDGKW